MFSLAVNIVLSF